MVVMRRQGLLGQKFIERGLIDEETLNKVLEIQKKTGEKLGNILINEKILSNEEVIDVMGPHLGIKGKTLNLKEIKIESFDMFTIAYMKQKLFIPYSESGNKLNVVMENPKDLKLIERIQRRAKLNIKPFYCTGDLILKRINEMEELKAQNSNKKIESILTELDNTGDGEIEFESGNEVEDLDRSFSNTSDALVVKGVNAMIAKAITMKASDIHVEPYENEIRIRYRVDGILLEVKKIPKFLINGFISRIKIMSSLDIAERRLPQDGRFRIKISGKYVDFRVSTIPTAYGEKAVMRILDRGSVSLNLKKLGFDKDSLKKLEKAIKSPYGIILVTGPTGSGKSTTLYSILRLLNTSEVNISTAEDPIEYELEGINQLQCRSEIGLTFANALRSFLRQDPDIIMVGEIRDSETSEIAIKAALTGHLVLSTLHTNDAPSSVHRLLDMGIEPFMISAALLMIQAQRLVRKVCPHCKDIDSKSDENLLRLGYSLEEYEGVKFYKGKGCEKCNGTGYKGRSAIHEMMVMSEKIKELVNKRASTVEIQKQAKLEGMKTLRDSGMEKAIGGETSLDEVSRVTLI